MPYVTDGSVHRSGVNNEHTLAEKFNAEIPEVFKAAYPEKPLTFQQKGGTKSVDDIVILSEGVRVSGISTKHHGGKSGSFDYINTSKVTDFVPNAEAAVKEIADIRRAHRGDASALPEARNQIKHIINTLWTSLSIRDLLQRIHERNSEWVSIVTPTEIVTVPHTHFKELSHFPYDLATHYELRGKGPGSRQIWRITEGIAVNTSLRMRLVLNNGVTALLGLSNANRSSILTLKVQQDNVNRLLKQIVHA